MKDIKIRIKSVESTMQITKAMELVASSKLRRAKERVERTRPFFNILHAALADIAYSNKEFSSPYIVDREVKKSCYVVVAGDRGLAGGYNSNLFKLAAQHMEGKDAVVLPIGKKTVEYFERRGVPLLTTDYRVVEQVGLNTCYAMAEIICRGYLAREFDEVYVVYTNFVSMLSQDPAVLKVLPLNYDRSQARVDASQELIIYEPSSEAVYDRIVPQYVSGILYGAVAESLASELGARRTAMEAANKNAGEMVEDLSLKYNRARQAVITQEITEIVSGAEAQN
ncbi:MAG: ATP synthase F1 subunit gamma [Oscillospiraceae bacterium]|nr:ATP synthase F1 subunit gamma [Oscillospiraceae bacterium]